MHFDRSEPVCITSSDRWDHRIAMSKVHPTSLTISACSTPREASMAISIRFWKERSWPPLAYIFNFLGRGRFGFFTGVLFFLPIFQTTWLHDLASPPLFLKTERESGRKSAISYWPNSPVLTPYVLIATFKLRVYRKNQYLSIFHKKAIWNIKNWLRMDKIIQFHDFSHSTEWSCKLSVFLKLDISFSVQGYELLSLNKFPHGRVIWR